jgi:glycosyltransferase involved in cell wall biosynthesis
VIFETDFNSIPNETTPDTSDELDMGLRHQLAEQSILLSELSAQIRELQTQLAAQSQQQQSFGDALASHTLLLQRPRRSYNPLLWLRRRCATRLFYLRQYAPQPLRLPPWYEQQPLPANPPSISIVTPSYNQADYLPRTIKSVLGQRYPRLEYFVQDGNSSDGSVAVIRKYERQLTGWASEPDDGQAEAINRGFARTSGEIMGWINSDDLLLPGTLAYVANYFERHPNVDVVYGSRVVIDENDHDVGRWLLPPHDDDLLRWVDYVPQETLFWRRDLWNRSGARLDESFDFALDWDLLLRFQAAGAKFACLPRFLGAFRVTESTKTSKNLETVGQREIDRLRLRSLGFVPDAATVHERTKPYLRRHIWRRLLGKLKIVRY